jgi:hypothetical protein
MTSVLFLELLRFDSDSDSVAFSKRRRHRVPVPLSVERLEDRTVPDATTNFVAAPTLIPVANAFSPFLTNTPVLVAGANYNAVSNQSLPLLTISAVNSLGQENQLDFLFGPNAVNSSGRGNPRARSWNPSAFGYGSGTKPGEPWAPAYMTLGLANPSAMPWGRTVGYGHGSGASSAEGGQAGPRPGGGGAAPLPGDTERPEKGKQGDVPRQDKDGEKKEQKKEEPKKGDQKQEVPKQKDQRKEQPKNGDQLQQRSGDKPDGSRDPARSTSSPVLPDRMEATLGLDANERRAAIDRILLRDSGDEKDESLPDGIAFIDPAILSGSLLLARAPSNPFSALLLVAESQSAADEGFAGGADGESMEGIE